MPFQIVVTIYLSRPHKEIASSNYSATLRLNFDSLQLKNQ